MSSICNKKEVCLPKAFSQKPNGLISSTIIACA
jgi:hypothetical protein